MILKSLRVKNFRLLHDVELQLEERTTVIVGRNNSGKTSLTEVIRRLLGDSPKFIIEDFSFASHQSFWDAYKEYAKGTDDKKVRELLPRIEVAFTFEYDPKKPLGAVGDFVIDLDDTCTQVLVIAQYGLFSGKVADLFKEVSALPQGGTPESEVDIKLALFKILKESLPACFECIFWAEDPKDQKNKKAIDGKQLRTACATGFIGAQRGLDDATQNERVVIGKVLESLFKTALVNEEDEESYTTAEALQEAVQDIQEKIGTEFNKKLDDLLPALASFGYPGLSDPELRTETTLEVNRLLTNYTRVRYAGNNGINLPESHNGLGARNIILILLQLREFFKLFLAMEPRPSVQLVCIEEPEVHLHPQMQEVFIRKLGEITAEFSKIEETAWPVQFIVSTHSAHVANEARFECVRYFTASSPPGAVPQTRVKDLRKGLAGKPDDVRNFLHQYLTLTRCDLFFADKAILIEGTTERLMLPRIIEKIDAGLPAEQKLSSRYVAIVEVGGAYAHIFFDFLDFLELKTLIITDIDSVKNNEAGKFIACPVHEGIATSNACINAWFSGGKADPASLVAIPDSSKVIKKRRIAYQVPEKSGAPCGRSFEDAFMLANAALFANPEKSAADQASFAWNEAQGIKKSKFALDYAVSNTTWDAPRYITEGLTWLVVESAATPATKPVTPGVAATTAPVPPSTPSIKAKSPPARPTRGNDGKQ